MEFYHFPVSLHLLKHHHLFSASLKALMFEDIPIYISVLYCIVSDKLPYIPTINCTSKYLKALPHLIFSLIPLQNDTYNALQVRCTQKVVY